MKQKQIENKITKLVRDQEALYTKFNKLWMDKPLGYKIRAAVVKNQILNIAGEIAAWRAKLGFKD